MGNVVFSTTYSASIYYYKNELMQADGFNKSTNHRFTTSELTVGLPISIYEWLLKIKSPREKIMEKVFTEGTLQSERRFLPHKKNLNK